jgi:hypothetical protein
MPLPPRISFLKASFVEFERCTWNMTYPDLQPPFFHHSQQYVENGLHIHLSKPDLEAAGNAIHAALTAATTFLGAAAGSAAPGPGTVTGAAAGAAVGGVLGELANACAQFLSYMVTNADGSFDLHIAPHALQSDDSTAIDPNVVSFGAWSRIAAWLAAFFGSQSSAPHAAAASAHLETSEILRRGAKSSQGKLVSTETLGAGAAEAMSGLA